MSIHSDRRKNPTFELPKSRQGVGGATAGGSFSDTTRASCTLQAGGRGAA